MCTQEFPLAVVLLISTEDADLWAYFSVAFIEMNGMACVNTRAQFLPAYV